MRTWAAVSDWRIAAVVANDAENRVRFESSTIWQTAMRHELNRQFSLLHPAVWTAIQIE